MSAGKVYGYVLLPVALTPRPREPIQQAVERLWRAGEFDLGGDVEHYHEDGGLPPTFVEAGNEFDALDLLQQEAGGGG